MEHIKSFMVHRKPTLQDTGDVRSFQEPKRIKSKFSPQE